MKNPIHSSLFGIMLTALLIFIFNPPISAQEKEVKKDVKIKIIKKENGETTVIDKVILAEDENELEDILKEYGVEPEMGIPQQNEEVEIIIKKKREGEENERILEVEHVEPPAMGIKTFLGVYFEQPSEEGVKELKLPESTGVLITQVIEGSAAEKAGLKTGDYVTKIGDKEIESSVQFRQVIGSFSPGDEVKINYIRDGKNESVNAILGNRKVQVERIYAPGDFHWKESSGGFETSDPEAKNRPFLGVALGSSETDLKEGFIIGRVIENSTAAEMGLKTGDVILGVNDVPVNNIEVLKEVMSKTKVGEDLKVEYSRGGEKMKAITAVKSRPESAERIVEWHGDKMNHCLEQMTQRVEEGTEMSKEMLKENLEKMIERTEMRLEKMRNELENLDKSEMEKEEKEIIITIENVNDAAKISGTRELEVNNLSFSPNPNDGKFSLGFDLLQKGKTTIKIFDLNNKEVYSETLNKFSGHYQNKLDISANAKGIYFLQISQGDKMINKKIVIQ